MTDNIVQGNSVGWGLRSKRKQNRLIWFFCALIVIIQVAIGLLGIKLLWSVDKAYTEFIDSTFQMLGDIRTNSTQILTIQTTCSSVLLASKPEEVNALLVSVTNLWREAGPLLDRIERVGEKQGFREAVANLKTIRNEYFAACNDFIALARTASKSDLEDFRVKTLRREFLVFNRVQDDLANLTTKAAANLNSNLSIETRSKSRLLGGLVIVPYCLCGILLVGIIRLLLWFVWSADA